MRITNLQNHSFSIEESSFPIEESLKNLRFILKNLHFQIQIQTNFDRQMRVELSRVEDKCLPRNCLLMLRALLGRLYPRCNVLMRGDRPLPEAISFQGEESSVFKGKNRHFRVKPHRQPRLQNSTFSIQNRTFLVESPNISPHNSSISIENQAKIMLYLGRRRVATVCDLTVCNNESLF